ncbi:hypothetical protein L596_017989 [Steinernema carpocapsae]|uniref:Uncharacterized protein n=1 Tax=Steinernema carpocapsae TaxID=34508 RepID=A0A4U5N429_STECR|nr:hypothetical protein L596_017989 [Steinernema carpocapsae]
MSQVALRDSRWPLSLYSQRRRQGYCHRSFGLSVPKEPHSLCLQNVPKENLASPDGNGAPPPFCPQLAGQPVAPRLLIARRRLRRKAEIAPFVFLNRLEELAAEAEQNKLQTREEFVVVRGKRLKQLS